ADAAAGEETDALAPAERQEAVDGSDARRERLSDARPLEGRWGPPCRRGAWADERWAAVERLAQAIEDAAEQRVTDHPLAGRRVRLHAVAWSYAVRVAEGHQAHLGVVEADDGARERRRVAADDPNEVSDARARHARSDRQAHQRLDRAH